MNVILNERRHARQVVYALVAQWTRAHGYEPWFVGGSNPLRCTKVALRLVIKAKKFRKMA